MIITQEIQMELQKIYTQDRGFAGQKGVYLCFDFNMIYPSSGSFFEQPTNYHEGEYTAMWGRSPGVTLFQKAGRTYFKKRCHDFIKNDLMYNAQEIKNPKWEINDFYLAVSDYSKPLNDREWSLVYSATARSEGDRNLVFQKNGMIVMTSSFMASVISDLPEEIKGKFRKEAEID